MKKKSNGCKDGKPGLYGPDLAYAHDALFGDFARDASRGLLRFLRRSGVRGGLVVDLGCGGGAWARTLSCAGYGVLGVDVSPAMLALARRRAPRAKFRRASLHEAVVPRCDAVTALGEAVAYGAEKPDLRRLFQRVLAALRPGGVFIFDVRESDAAKPGAPRVGRAENQDCAVTYRVEREGRRLLRRMTVFRKIGSSRRRSENVHWLTLFARVEILRELKRAGFAARVLRRYGRRPLPAGVVGFLARKKS